MTEENLGLEVTKISSKGQVVIPTSIKKVSPHY